MFFRQVSCFPERSAPFASVLVFALIFVFVFVFAFHNTAPCDLLLVFEPAGQNWRNFAMRLDRSGGWWGLPAVMGLFVHRLETGCKYKDNQDNQDNQDNRDKDMEFFTIGTR